MNRSAKTRLTLKETTSGHRIPELKRDLGVGSPDPPHAVGDSTVKLLPHSCFSERAVSRRPAVHRIAARSTPQRGIGLETFLPRAERLVDWLIS